MPAGTLDLDPGTRPCEHVWVGCEAAWEAQLEDFPRLTEAEFILDGVRTIDQAGGENVADHYGFIVEHYANSDAASPVAAKTKARLAELSQTSE